MVCGFRVYQKEYQNMFVFPPAWFILFLLLFIFYFYILPPVQNCSSCYGPQTCKVRLNIYQVTDCPTLIVNCIWERHFALFFFHLLFLHSNMWMLLYCKWFHLLIWIYTWAWYGKKVRCMYSSQNSALFATKCCMIDAVLQFWAMTDGNATLRKIKNWHGRKKQPRMSRLLQRQNVSRCFKVGWVYVIWNLHQDPGSLTTDKAFSLLRDLSDNWWTFVSNIIPLKLSSEAANKLHADKLLQLP